MKKTIKIIIYTIVTIIDIILLINLYIYVNTNKNITTINDLKDKDIDCILILGASIIDNNYPSKMLEDRLKTGIKAYQENISNKILVSGDHTYDDYDEVKVMKNYLLERNIPSENIFVDHYGISSYDSIYRTNKIYKANKVVIITQKYHLYRSLYIAKHLNMEVYGISADNGEYSNKVKRNIREYLANVKDFFKCIFNAESKNLGEVFPINGNGNKTNSK